ncbi:hypothetical protein C8T65DRAFT_699837 [Cerioporus squamosus]|nr:hypothetical protein C8T65DRAFT_699837 [Cerioporus squamosus]
MARTCTRGQLLFLPSRPLNLSAHLHHKTALASTSDTIQTELLFLFWSRTPRSSSPPSGTLKLSDPDPDDLRGSVRKLITELLARAVHRQQAQMRTLIGLMLNKKLYFARATSAQLRIARLDASGISPGPLHRKALPLPNLCRRDMGSRKTQYDDEGNARVPRYARDGPKSAKMIEEPEDDTVETDTQPSVVECLCRGCVISLGTWDDLPDGGLDHEGSDSDSISEFTDDE